MKIRSFAYKVVSVPVRYSVISSVRRTEQIPFILLEIETEEGISGISYAQAFNEKAANSVIQLLDNFADLLAERNPLATESRWREMWEATVLLGHSGLVSFAVSLVDIALWDLKGKYFELPIYRLLGGEKDTFDVYASDGLWLGDADEALRQSEQFVQEGFRTFKMRMGREHWQEDIEVLRLLRKEWGDAIEIMADVNQGWTRHKAKDMIRRLEDYHLYWLEEPISTRDIEGYTDLHQTSTTRICFGENIYGIQSSAQCILKKTASYFTPDLQRIGGVTGWLKLAPLLELYRIPCALHLFPEFSIHLLSTYPYAEKMEWMSWATNLFKEPLKCINGSITVPDRSGFGMEFVDYYKP